LLVVEFERLVVGVGRSARIGPRQHGDADDVRVRDRGDSRTGDSRRNDLQWFFGSEDVSQTFDRFCCRY
jgi:hypothetical protein